MALLAVRSVRTHSYLSTRSRSRTNTLTVFSRAPDAPGSTHIECRVFRPIAHRRTVYSNETGEGEEDTDREVESEATCNMSAVLSCALQRRRVSTRRRAVRPRLPQPRVPGAPASDVSGAHSARVHHAGPRSRRPLRALLRASERRPAQTVLLRPVGRHRRARRCVA